MKTNYHTYTTRCMYAVGDNEDYVRSAIKGGFQELGFSDHNPWEYHTNFVSDICMLPEELPEYVESIRILREKYRSRISIRIGLECEYFPEYTHRLKEIIREYRLDYILFGNHHYYIDEKSPYFGHHATNRDMLDLYEESSIEGMGSGLFTYLAYLDLFMRSYPEFDIHCTSISRHIYRAAARPNASLEYNVGYMVANETRGIVIYPCPQFQHITANEGRTAIIGLDAYNNLDLENPVYYDWIRKELKELKMSVIGTVSFLGY